MIVLTIISAYLVPNLEEHTEGEGEGDHDQQPGDKEQEEATQPNILSPCLAALCTPSIIIQLSLQITFLTHCSHLFSHARHSASLGENDWLLIMRNKHISHLSLDANNSLLEIKFLG